MGPANRDSTPGRVDGEPLVPGWLLSGWLWLRALGRVLWLTRFSVATVAIGAYALLANDQAQEVLREFASNDDLASDAFEITAFALATLLWCWNTWSWARTLTSLRWPEASPPQPRDIPLRIWVPRLLGWIPAFIVPLALMRAAAAFDQSPLPTPVRIYWLAGALFAGAVAFVGWTLARRRIVHDVGVEVAAAAPYTLGTLPRFDWASGIVTWIVTIVLFLLFLFAPATTAPWFGAAAILLAALAAWIPFGSLLVYLSARWHHVPLFAVLLLAAAVFSLWNDNHAVRTLDEAPAAAIGDVPRCGDEGGEAGKPSRYPLCDYALAWLKARRTEIERAPGPYPVYLVAAAGGGIRAAYWTAGVLAELQDRDPAFARHTFAISGVSGGSLGAMAFRGMLEREDPCRIRSRAVVPLRLYAKTLFAGDFLAPTLGAMLYPDLVQWFFPVAVARADRARAMEEGWETRWHAMVGDTWLGGSYETLVNARPECDLPLVFLNTTTVEGGKRAIVAPLPVMPLEFSDAVDVRAVVGKAMRLSTAVHLSARFMYVSPAATVHSGAGGTAWGHLVDGGYFENSGAATIADALAMLERAAAEAGLAQRIVPVVLLVGNDPHAPRILRDQTQPQSPAADPAPLRVLVEPRAPIETMLNTRDGRGARAQAVVKRAVEWRGKEHPQGRIDFYQPYDNGIPLPLGWMLSESARIDLDAQIGAQIEENATPR